MQAQPPGQTRGRDRWADRGRHAHRADNGAQRAAAARPGPVRHRSPTRACPHRHGVDGDERGARRNAVAAPTAPPTRGTATVETASSSIAEAAAAAMLLLAVRTVAVPLEGGAGRWVEQ